MSSAIMIFSEELPLAGTVTEQSQVRSGQVKTKWCLGRPVYFAQNSCTRLELRHPRCVCNIKAYCKEVKTQLLCFDFLTLYLHVHVCHSS